MVIVNFAHPITDAQTGQIELMAQETVERIIDVPTQFEESLSFSDQAAALMNTTGLSGREWQTAAILVVLPSLSVIAALIVAEIHGRAGHFPAVLRMRPVTDAAVRKFEVAEILDLQTVRDSARESRTAQNHEKT